MITYISEIILCGHDNLYICHAGSARAGWQSLISQGKISLNTLPWLGIDPGPRGGQTMRFIHFPTELPVLYEIRISNNRSSYRLAWQEGFFKFFKWLKRVLSLKPRFSNISSSGTCPIHMKCIT